MTRRAWMTAVVLVMLAVAGVGLALWSLPGRQPETSPVGKLVPAKGVVLVAARKMADPRFRQTVVLLLKHDNGGTLGLVVNRPTRVSLEKALPKIKDLAGRKEPIFFGGPVALRVVIFLARRSSTPPESGHVFADVYYSASSIALAQILERDADNRRLRVFFGHAGWAAGQLEVELSRGDWHLARVDAATLFEARADGLWRRLINRLEPLGLQTRSDQTLDAGALL
jgi:putative transcriptional regulator